MKNNSENSLIKNPWTYIFGFLILTLIIILYSYNQSSNNTPGEYDTFAQCLTDKGLKMYGTEWCSHCKAQKKRFGTSFQYIDYRDCDYEKEICTNEGITGYPTWKFEGKSYPGEMELNQLSELTGCEL